jgi:hypothetical protein
METENMNQLYIDDNGIIAEEPMHDTLEIEQVDYKKLDKVDLVRLCTEKDTAIKSYETERKNSQDKFNKEIEDMNEYYVLKIKELKSLIKYYEKKFTLIKDLINIEKGDDK